LRQPLPAPGHDAVPGRARPRPHLRVPVPRLDLRYRRRPARRALSRRLRRARPERVRARGGPAGIELPGLRLRLLRGDRHPAPRAPRRRDAADRPLVRSLADRGYRADRGLGEASLRGQLEGAPRERQRRLPPGLRAPRALQDRAHAVPARGRRREGDQGGGARLGARAHRDRLVARLPGAVRVVRRSLGPGRGRLRGRARAPGRAGAGAAAHHAGAGPRPHLPQPLPRGDQHRDRRAGGRGGVRALAHPDVLGGRAPVQRAPAADGRGGHGPRVLPDAGGSDRRRPQPAGTARAHPRVAPAQPGPQSRIRGRTGARGLPRDRRDHEPGALAPLPRGHDGGLAAPPPMVSDQDHQAVVEFLYREARLADEARYAEWLALWTDDAVYWVPASTDPAADPETRISHIYDNRNRLETRIKLLQTGHRYSQEPASLMRRLISNIEVTAEPDGELVAGSN